MRKGRKRFGQERIGFGVEDKGKKRIKASGILEVFDAREDCRETAYSLMMFSSVSPLSLRKAAVMHPVRCLRQISPRSRSTCGEERRTLPLLQ